MLFKLVDQSIAGIEALDTLVEGFSSAAAFAAEMRRHRAPIVQQVEQNGRTAASDIILQGFASACIEQIIKPIPSQASRLCDVVRSEREPLHLRCAVAGSLAYLVQPHDLIPDHAPGGYGFLDDAVLIRTALSLYLVQADESESEATKHRNVARLAGGACSPAVLTALESAAAGCTLGFRILRGIPDSILSAALSQVIEDPLNASVQAGGRPWMPAQPTGPLGPSPIELRNLLGMTFSAEGDTMAATFPDGEGVIVSGNDIAVY